MSSNVILYCEQLKSVIGSKDTKKASTNLDAIDQYFNDRISENEIDLAVAKVFDENNGVLGFVKLCLKQNKTFKDVTVKSFDLFIKIIELYPNRMNQYATDTIIICLQYLHSMQTTAREKEKAGTVIETLVLKNCCDDVDRRYLMTELFKVAEQLKAGTVQCRIFGLIGSLTKDYPDCIENATESMKIRDMYFKALENAVINRQDATFPSLTGAFNGLNDFLENFGPSESHKDEFSERVYKCIKLLANPKDTSQIGVHRSALNVLASRCELFGKQVFDDFFFWHNLLVNTWLKMDSFENRRPAIFLLHAMNREVANRLLTDDDADRCREILKFLQSYFNTTLESSTSQPYEVRLSIVGFGLIAAPCKKLLSSKYLNELLHLVMQRTESAANTINYNSKEQLEHFPDYVEALSRIMEHVDQLSDTQLNILQNIIVSLIRHFHLLSVAHHDMTINTLMRTFHNLSELGDTIFDEIIEKVVYQGVIWTCSHKLPFDAKNDWDGETKWTEQVTYVSYLPLWNGFLAEFESTTYDRSPIISKIYDQMMNTLFKILDKLNLTLNKRVYRDDHGNDQELFFSDPNYALEPVRVKDFHIFFNLVGFYNDILKAQTLNSHKTHFLKWINCFTEVIISKSLKHPLISGFLKLAQRVLSIANRMDYFGNDLYEDSQTIYDDVYFYLSTTIRKAQQSCGELQIACLKLLFTTPTCILESLIHDMIPAFQVAFDIGRSNASLFIAGMALSTIERYMTTVSRTSNKAMEFLRVVLPYFDAYLQGFKNDAIKSFEIARTRVKGTKRTAKKLIKVKENDLLKFQKRIILFLGTLEPEYCLFVIQNGNKSLVKWNTTATVGLTLYGPNFNPKIYIDALIPRICEIATSTTDRQKKITACEIVQATILYLIGSNNYHNKLWEKLCKLMLELGCDGDVGVQQMFEPLVMQTMHYLSKPENLQLQGTEILLKCLLDAISHPTNLPVRDLASRSLREFLSWAIRQARRDQLAASPFKIDSLIQKLKVFNSDALHQKRFGAALAFNNIYRVLREEDLIVDKYWLDLLHDFCLNFKLSEQQLERNLHCEMDLKQVSASLDHILRVLRERNHIFNRSNANRTKTIAFNDTGREPLLLDAVLWLLSECNSSQSMYRKKTMEMFVALAPCVENYNSTAMFIQNNMNIESVVAFCDNHIQIEHVESRSFSAWHIWLKKIRTSLDCYIWFIENNFMSQWKSIFEQSNVFNVLEYYIIEVLNKNLFDYASIAEKDKINSERSAILLLICQFLNKTMSIGCVPDVIWQQVELIWMIERAVFHPQQLECDAKNPEFLAKLPKSLETFIGNVYRWATSKFKKDLNDKLIGSTLTVYEHIADSIDEILSGVSISTADMNNLKGVDLICGLIQTKSVQLEENSQAHINMLASKVLYQLFESIKDRHRDNLIAKSPSPDTQKFTNYLLQICFYKDGLYVNLIDLLLNTTELKMHDSSKTIKHGKHFLSLYKSTIYKYFFKHVDIIAERLISKILPPNVSYVLHILMELIEFAYKIGAQNIPQMKSLTNILLGKWPEILKRSERHEGSKSMLINLIGRIAMICPYELTDISKKAQNIDNWLLNIINNDDDTIDIKTQAIFLLPCLIGPATYEHQEVQNALENYQTKYFPLYTSELRPGTVDRTTFENAFQVILDTMCASKSFVMLKFIINCTAQDSEHIMDFKIMQSIRKFMNSLKSEHQLHCLNQIFEMFCNISFDATIRTALIKRFLSQMLLGSTKDIVLQFYALHIRKIEQLLETPYGLEMSDFKLEQAFTSRIGGFELCEIMLVIFTREEICDTKCPILIAKFGDRVEKGNELLSWLSKKASKSESFQTANVKYMEWFRKYQCAAFKTLCVLLTNTSKQDSLRFYDKCVFIEKNFLNIINTIDNNLYKNQTLEVDKRPQIKQRMVMIRQLPQHVDNATTPTRKYIETQNVFESSLSQDVTKVDLNSSSVRSQEEVDQKNVIAKFQPKTLMLEQNSVNDHEVMATICAVIEHMFVNKITPSNEDGSLCRRKLAWVTNINQLIANSNNNVHINVRIFLVTMVDNCSKLFQNYADVMTPAILKFLVDWTKLTGSIDALTVFLLVDLLEWDATYRITKTSTIEEQNLASDLMANLMTRAYHPQREVFRRSLELIRNVMERWRDFISLPHQFLYERISDKNTGSKANICGLHLNGIVLANELTPWTEESREDFLKAILNCVNNDISDVFQPAAQVLGMALNEIIVRQNNGVINDEMMTFINKIVDKLNNWKRNNEKKFMYVLYFIDKHYVIKDFITTIAGLIASSTPQLKRFYLQMFLARVNDVEARDVEMFLLDLLNQTQESQHQLIGLHIFNKALPKMSISQIKKVLPRVASFQDAKQTEIRDVVYEIMKYIHENFNNNDDEVNQIATDILLKGLNDVDKGLQSLVFKYWNELPELPAALNDRILFMLRHLYKRDFLTYAVQLLIDLKSADLKKKLLTTRSGDDDSKYTEYDINVHWKSQDSTLRVPLFTESQQKQIISGEMDPTQGYLRATQQTLHFDPTMDPSTLYEGSSSFSLQTQSSLLFTGPVQVLDRRSQQSNVSSLGTRTKLSYLRERILRNKDAAGREKALSAVKRQEYLKKEETKQQQRKQGQVTLYRRYRFGDFPDFFINSLAFLLPLQVLVKLDTILARNTFVTIVNAVYVELEDDNKRNFLHELAQSIENIIQQVDQCDPMVFSALTEITLTNNAKLRINPGITTSLPNSNDMMINAILLLENGLITMRGSNNETWAELANMYYSLSEYDVAASIFSDKLESDSLLSLAIESESNGNYQMALKSYTELINKTSDAAVEYLWSKHATDFSYQSLFNCYEVMGRWEDLECNVISQLGDDENSQAINYEQLWTDEWNTKYLLPHYIRSEVRTLIYSAKQTTHEFLANIQQWLRNPTRAEFIKKHFGEQLMILHVANNDYLEAKVFSNQYFESFLNEWSAMSVFSEKMRYNKLMNTRRVAEIHKYADMLCKPVDDTVIADLMDRWKRTQINKADSLQMWEALIAYRIFVTEHALDKFQLRNVPIVDRLIESMFDMQFKLNEIAVQQNNIELSNTVLRRLDTFRTTYGQNTVKSNVQYELAAVRREQIKWMNDKEQDPYSSLGKLLGIWSDLRHLQDERRTILDANPDIRIKVLNQFNQITDCVSEIVSKCGTLDEDTKQKIAGLTTSTDDSQSVSQLIGTFARRCCNETIDLAEKCEKSRSQMYSTNFSMQEHGIGESYYRLAIFSLKQSKIGSKECQIGARQLLIKSVLRGMRHASKNARLQFPRLLQLPEINSKELTTLFNQEMNEVPLWTFLSWTTQIISHFNFEKECFLDDLLLRLATTYPAAVIYSFKYAFDQFYEKKPNAAIRSTVQQILNAIKNPTLEKFIEHIRYLSLPDNVMLHHLDIISSLQKIEKIKRELKKCYNNVFGNKRGRSSSTMNHVKNDFVELMQTEDDEQIRKRAKNMITNLSNKYKNTNENLDYFSPWLVQYHWNGGDNYIELPGQYTGTAQPNPDHILKIVKFDEKVSILHSLRRPIKLSAICSDGKTYSFLVKYGEDLRQDERIQQIQELMSDQMKTDRNCSQQKMSLRTYKVIPFSKDYGIISWVENTDTIHSLLAESDKKWRNLNGVVMKEYEIFLNNSQKDASRQLYRNITAALYYTPQQIAENLEKLQKMLPQNVLRKSLYQMSASPECFFALRNNFAKSLAAICVAHWILGIGDRHLGNFIIDQNTAELIGIDFNMAFGAATRNQRIPELVPFRLTKQLVDVMKPFETSGFLVKCMAHVLRAFRSESQSLMAALEVFIRDTSSNNNDFFNCGSTSIDGSFDSSTKITAHSPEHHLAAINDKLNGINPIVPIERDLKLSYFSGQNDVIAAYTKLLNGTPNKYRYMLARRNLSVEDQIKCLIEIATDRSILGIAYQGFRPWV